MALTGAQQRELDALRRRAYGRRADSAMDADAWRRLTELEHAVAAPGEARTAVTTEPAHERRATPVRGERSTSATPTAVFVDPGPEPARAKPERPSRIRSGLPWMVAAVASIVAVTAVVLLVAGSLSGTRPAMRLDAAKPPDSVQKPRPQSVLEFWGIGNQPYDYRGTLGDVDLWTVSDGFTMRCVMFSIDGEFVAQNCAPLPLAAIYEAVSGPDDSPLGSLGGDVPDGTYVRFLWEGETLDIYLVPPSELLGV